jgi:hypothetical protein
MRAQVYATDSNRMKLDEQNRIVPKTTMYIALIAASIYVMSLFVVSISASAYSASPLLATKPKLLLKPSTVGEGKKVRVKGVRFTPSSLVTVSVGGKAVGSNKTDINGTFTLNIKAPNTAGTQTVSATDSHGKTASASLIVTASNTTPKITILVSGPYGGTKHVVYAIVHINGTNFANSSPITITFRGDVVASTKSNSTGGFMTQFTIPQAPAGTYFIVASDGTNSVPHQFKLVPHLSASSHSVKPGAMVTLSGNGYAASSMVSFTFNGAIIGSTTTNSTGGFSGVKVQIPPSTPIGSYRIVGTDSLGNSAGTKENVI